MQGGVYVANVTPFKDDETFDVDTEAYLAHVEWLRERGVRGIVPFGTNGEGPSATLGEKLGTLEKLFERGPSLEIIPNVAQGNVPETLEFLRWLEDKPVAAVMVLPPYYFKPASPEGLKRFYEMALAESGHPIVMYHIPKYAVPIPVEVVASLPVWGVKDSGGDAEYTRSVLEAGKDVLLDTEDDLWSALNLGARGIISAMANFIPEEIVEMDRRVSKGDEAGGKELSGHLQRVRAMTKEHTSAAVLKRLAEARHGFPMGTVRPPLVPAPADYDPQPTLEAATSA